MALYAACGLGQSGHLAGALGRSAGEKLVDGLEVEAGLLGDHPDGRRDLELEEVFA